MKTYTTLPIDAIIPGQHHRAFDPARVADLADSIARVGLLQPPVVTPAHILIAGRHRLEAARSLGWHKLPVLVVTLDELQAELATLDENLVRNDLTRLERFEHLARRAELLDALGSRRKAGRYPNPDTVSGLPRTTDEIAGESGLSGRTLQRAQKIVCSIPRDVREQLRSTQVADSTTELDRLSRLSHEEQRAVADLLAAGQVGTVTDLHLQAKRERRRQEAARQARKAEEGSHQNVYVGDFDTVADVIPDGQAALFCCDPPYADVAVYSRLARLAARKLRPGGWLAAYADVGRMPQAMAALAEGLSYYWTFAIQYRGVGKQRNAYRLRSCWKPVLVYHKPPRRQLVDWGNDVIVGGDNVKDHHSWQQPVSEARYLIERLTDPGDLVVDPTCGSGSALVAAKLAGRRWLGIEIDSTTAETARMRLREVTSGPR